MEIIVDEKSPAYRHHDKRLQSQLQRRNSGRDSNATESTLDKYRWDRLKLSIKFINLFDDQKPITRLWASVVRESGDRDQRIAAFIPLMVTADFVQRLLHLDVRLIIFPGRLNFFNSHAIITGTSAFWCVGERARIVNVARESPRVPRNYANCWSCNYSSAYAIPPV